MVWWKALGGCNKQVERNKPGTKTLNNISFKKAEKEKKKKFKSMKLGINGWEERDNKERMMAQKLKQESFILALMKGIVKIAKCIRVII